MLATLSGLGLKSIFALIIQGMLLLIGFGAVIYLIWYFIFDRR